MGPAALPWPADAGETEVESVALTPDDNIDAGATTD
jgi:hypothetical protein